MQSAGISQKNFQNSKAGIVAAIVFLVCFGWMLILTQGLPVGDFDDWDHILAAQDLSWDTLMSNTLTPWSKSATWVGQTDRINEVTHRRVLLSVGLKAANDVFGLHFFPFYIFNEAIFISGTVTFIFLLLFSLCGSIPIAICGALFYLLVPANYGHALWLTDPITMVHFFATAAILAYLNLTENIRRQTPAKELYGWFAILIVAGWLAMKAKEPAVTLPVSLGLYTLTRFKDWKNQKTIWILILAVVAWHAFLLVPITHIHDTAPVTPKPHEWENLWKMLFRNYANGYDDEIRSAFFDWDSVWPSSIARTFTFFSLWTLIIFVILYGLAKFGKPEAAKSIRFLGHPLVGISLFWVAIEIFMMARFQNDPRYFSGTMIPLTLLSARLIDRVFKLWPEWRKFLVGAVIFCVAWTVYNNIQHTIYLRLLIGKRFHRLLNTAKIIHGDAYPQHPQDLRSVAFFYTSMYPPPPGSPRMESVLYYAPLEYERWNKTNSPTAEGFIENAKKGYVYYVAYDQKEILSNPNIKLLATLDGINRESLFERVMYKLKKKKAGNLNIFKYSAS